MKRMTAEMSDDILIQALRRMTPETGSLHCLGCGYEHGCSLHGRAVINRAVERLEQLTAPGLNTPLTLEELREMDKEPVYVDWVKSAWCMNGEWAFVCLKWKGCKMASGGAVFFDRYGEWWLAYRRKPEEAT